MSARFHTQSIYKVLEVLFVSSAYTISINKVLEVLCKYFKWGTEPSKVHSSSEIFGCFLVSIGAAALIKNLVYNIFHGFVLLAITNRIAISSIKDDDRDAEAS